MNTDKKSVPAIFRQRANYTITTGATGLHLKTAIPPGDLIDTLTSPLDEPARGETTTPTVTYRCGCPLIERDGQQFADINHECPVTA